MKQNTKKIIGIGAILSGVAVVGYLFFRKPKKRVMPFLVAEWKKDIKMDSESSIDSYISIGLDRTAQSVIPFKKGTYNWCGAFAGYGYVMSGFNKQLAYPSFGSTYRVGRLADYGIFEIASVPGLGDVSTKEWHSKNNALRLKQKPNSPSGLVWMPEPDDILIIDKPNAKSWGAHVAVVESYEPGAPFINAIEGNSCGTQPSGYGCGVDRKKYYFESTKPNDVTSWIHSVIRFSPLDWQSDVSYTSIED